VDPRLLAMTRKSPTLLPCVQEVYWESDDEMFQLIHFMLGPNTRSLELVFDGSSVNQLLSLSELKYRYRNLTHVNLWAENEKLFPCYPGAIESALHGWNQLRQLHINDPSPGVLDCIATLPQLECLILFSHFEHIADSPPRQKAGIALFPSLKNLRVNASTWPVCTKLFAAILPIHALCSMRVKVEAKPSTYHLYGSLDAMHSQYHCSIRISPSDIQYFAANGDGINYHTEFTHLLPILAFSNISYAYLEMEDGLCLDDASIETIAIAWPRVVSLTLLMHWNIGSKKITLSGLRAFAHHSQHLRCLKVQVNAKETPKLSLGKPILNNTLVKLDVLYSPISHMGMVAAFLTEMFPVLAKIESAADSYFKGEWMEVQRHVDMFHSENM
jgi:hypothetical protein